MTSVDETLPISDQDKERRSPEPVNDEVETNDEARIENKEDPPGQAPTSIACPVGSQDQTPTEFCEEIKEKNKSSKTI